jgi:RNA polymerase sigma-70 factor (ECF subfamily)
MTEEGLVRPALSVDRAEMFTQLAERHLDSSYRLASLIVGDLVEAEDATHDALVRAWRSWPSLRDPSRFEAWFQRILVNACHDRLRGRRRYSQKVSVQEPLVADATGTTAEREALLAALRTLSVQHRTVVVLRYYEDLSVEEIADRVRAPAGTVKSRLHHGLRALRAAYDAAERAAREVQR